jgi:hypothetical protein
VLFGVFVRFRALLLTRLPETNKPIVNQATFFNRFRHRQNIKEENSQLISAVIKRL